MIIFDAEAFFHQFLYDARHPLLFNSGFFICLFTLFTLLYYTLRHFDKARRYVFIFFSLYFFYKASGWFVVIVLISAAINFLLAKAIPSSNISRNRKALLLMGVIINLLVLFYFKYTDFFIIISGQLLNSGFHPLNILLPVGISFYTFENLSYLIDIYRNELNPVRRFSDYVLFLTFFPKMVMGPIVRAADFIPQIHPPYTVTDQQFSEGFLLILGGLFKKLIISDYITANFTDYIFSQPSLHTGQECLIASYAYAIVIYCDFSGYSDIAIGLARWLGFTLPANFKSPYKSRTITDFWRKWHISLSSWLKDYLYIPMGGNRHLSKGSYLLCFTSLVLVMLASIHSYHLRAASWLVIFFFGGIIALPAAVMFYKNGSRTIAAGVNQWFTMILGGLWHGANLNFLVWGAWHGFGLAIHKTWTRIAGKKSDQHLIWRIAGTLLTFHFVCAGWVLFRTATLDDAVNFMTRIAVNFDAADSWLLLSHYYKVLLMMLLGYVLHFLPDSATIKVNELLSGQPVMIYVLLLLGMALLYSIIGASEQILPIYFQF